jgi:prepilin-type N-terminal cleavage/methylation domain-containing protein
MKIEDAMFKVRLKKLSWRSILREQKGDTLIENLVAIVLLAIVAAAIFASIQTAIKTFGQMNTKEASKDIAASEMDYIFSQPYASNYTVFNPNSGPVGTIVTVPTASGWSSSDTSFSVKVGPTIATNTLVVSSSGNLSGTITIPSVTTGFQTISITGAVSGTQTFTNAFSVTTTAAQYPAEYVGYTSSISITNNFAGVGTEQKIVLSISYKGSVIYTLTDYRTYY